MLGSPVSRPTGDAPHSDCAPAPATQVAFDRLGDGQISKSARITKKSSRPVFLGLLLVALPVSDLMW